MYFMQYGLRARERRKAGFEAPELGTFVHYVLENVAAEAKASGGFKKLSESRVRRLAGKYASKYAETIFTGREHGDPRFMYLFNRLRAAVDAVVLDVASELSASDFEPLDFELRFADGGDLPPAEFGDIRLSGAVDRVDGWVNPGDGKLYLRVADYKTGRKEFSLSDVQYGIGIQMLIYLFVLAEQGQSRYRYDTAPAGVLYTPARDVLLSLPRSSSAEDIAKKRAEALRRSGLLLSDRAVIEAMEHGKETKFIPVKFKDGAPAGSLADAERLGKLGRYVKKLLTDMGETLKNGSIEANPWKRARTAAPVCTAPIPPPAPLTPTRTRPGVSSP
jgi:ATP-dependent helicase/nuclease subunit B